MRGRPRAMIVQHLLPVALAHCPARRVTRSPQPTPCALHPAHGVLSPAVMVNQLCPCWNGAALFCHDIAGRKAVVVCCHPLANPHTQRSAVRSTHPTFLQADRAVTMGRQWRPALVCWLVLPDTRHQLPPPSAMVLIHGTQHQTASVCRMLMHRIVRCCVCITFHFVR